MKKKLLIIGALLAFAFAACEKEDNPLPGKYSQGVFISNEGPFMDGSGTISFYDPKTKTIQNDIFELANNRPLGNIVQSVEVFKDKAYVVVNNASKIEVVNAGTFESTGVIEGLSQPRYFLGINEEKAYVSDWAGHVAIINLNKYEKKGTISTSHGPDRMILSGSNVWVLNSAGMSSDSTLMIIDTNTDKVIHTMVVGGNPSDLVQDKEGNIWVICGGVFDWMNPENNTDGSLVKINPNDFSIIGRTMMEGTDFAPKLAVNKEKNRILFSYNGKIYSLNTGASSLNAFELVMEKTCYALGIDPDNDEIYFSDPLDFSQSGVIYRYDASGSTMIDSVRAGIIPGNLRFIR